MSLMVSVDAVQSLKFDRELPILSQSNFRDKPMIKKLQAITIYKDPFYYIAFPSCITLDNNEILVSCRRALDPRYLLTDDAPKELKSKVIHVEARSHQAIVRLDANLEPIGEPETVPLNTEAADQDGSLIKLASGRILLSAFSWYPFPPPFADTIRTYKRPFHGTPETTGANYLMWGAFTRHTDDNGKTWHTSGPFPALGTGEGAVAELSDGRIYYNSRRHWDPAGSTYDRALRWAAWSTDGGATWKDPQITTILPDGARGSIGNGSGCVLAEPSSRMWPQKYPDPGRAVSSGSVAGWSIHRRTRRPYVRPWRCSTGRSRTLPKSA